jgi:hypothetical protein
MCKSWTVNHELTSRAQIVFSRSRNSNWSPSVCRVTVLTRRELRDLGITTRRFGYGYATEKDWQKLAEDALYVRQRVAAVALFESSLLGNVWKDGTEFPTGGRLPRMDGDSDTNGIKVYCLEDMTIETDGNGRLRMIDDFAILIEPNPPASAPQK